MLAQLGPHMWPWGMNPESIQSGDNRVVTSLSENLVDPLALVLIVSSFAFLALIVFLMNSREDICQRVREFEWDHPMPRFLFAPPIIKKRHRHHRRHHHRKKESAAIVSSGLSAPRIG
jgi:hypothetical protein